MSTPTDNPISREADDLLGRSATARDFADHVLSLDASQGLVVAVLGPWGSGKTSFVNLSRTRFAERGVALLDFNPWMFSGADQLVESFFVEIAAELRLKKPDRADIADAITDYGEAFSGLAWLPVAGPWIERGRGTAKLLAKLLAKRKEGAGGRRQKLIDTLRHVESPIVVVLDDIDRLSTAEIRDIFKLVRLTASFPNVIYVVAFDRVRVERALSEEGIPGRDYLEKILQLGVDLPAVPEPVLRQQILEAIDVAMNSLPDHGPFDEQLWPDVFMEVIRPLIRHMRDIRRYIAAAHGMVRSINGHIGLVDVLALEAIRVFLPDVFARLPQAVEALTTPSDLRYGGDDPDAESYKQELEALVTAAHEHANVVRAMVARLFPAGSRHLPGGSHYSWEWQRQWIRDRRVAHTEILNLYLARVAGEGLAAHSHGEQLFEVMGDEAAFTAALDAIDLHAREDAIAALEAFEERFEAAHIVPA
jgi:predicted KAP-like P-loop ATPase